MGLKNSIVCEHKSPADKSYIYGYVVKDTSSANQTHKSFIMLMMRDCVWIIYQN